MSNKNLLQPFNLSEYARDLSGITMSGKITIAECVERNSKQIESYYYKHREEAKQATQCSIDRLDLEFGRKILSLLDQN